MPVAMCLISLNRVDLRIAVFSYFCIKNWKIWRFITSMLVLPNLKGGCGESVTNIKDEGFVDFCKNEK